MKSQNHLDKCIQCPKCGTRTMRKAVGQGPEYFDDKCHSYFTIEELVNEWSYDLGDFGDTDAPTFYKIAKLKKYSMYYPTIILEQNPKPQEYEIVPVGFFPNETVEDKIVATTWFDSMSSFVVDEPTFKSPSERLEAYEMVDRMIIGIPEWSMEQNEVDTGALHA